MDKEYYVFGEDLIDEATKEQFFSCLKG